MRKSTLPPSPDGSSDEKRNLSTHGRQAADKAESQAVSRFSQAKEYVRSHATVLIAAVSGFAALGAGAFEAYEHVPEVRQAVNRVFPTSPVNVVTELGKMGFTVQTELVPDSPQIAIVSVACDLNMFSEQERGQVQSLCEVLHTNRVYLLLPENASQQQKQDIALSLLALTTAKERYNSSVMLEGDFRQQAASGMTVLPGSSDEKLHVASHLSQSRESIERDVALAYYVARGRAGVSKELVELNKSHTIVTLMNHSSVVPDALRYQQRCADQEKPPITGVVVLSPKATTAEEFLSESERQSGKIAYAEVMLPKD